MKVGLYGDSYVDPYVDKNFESVRIPWSEYLIQQIGPIVDNYGINGSNLWTTWKKFKQTHSQYEKIVIAVTSVHRYIINSPWGNPEYYPGFSAIEDALKIGRYSWQNVPEDQLAKHKQNLSIFKEYIIRIGEDDYRSDMHYLMVEDIKRTRPDALLIPCFYGSLDREPPDPKKRFNNLSDISYLDVQTLKKETGVISESFYSIYYDLRANHFSNENNQKFASLINQWVKTGIFDLNSVDWSITNNPFEFYFRKK